ncbi:MAG: hypothetical protein C4523_12880 [Myxococcales bacterium]|nr:MAG: hypothetical protein C4523_12880 [Myxococcales bacterium]
MVDARNPSPLNRCTHAGVSLRLLALALLFAAVARNTIAQENNDCLECHGKKGLQVDRDGRSVSLYIDGERFSQSIHATQDCVACHVELEDVATYPHATGLQRVNCTECHEDGGPIADYWASTHGQLVEKGDKDAPHCQDCHGDHYVLPLKDPNSVTSPFNIPSMCALCHAEGAEVERTHDIPEEQVFERYKDSIHGEGLFKQGLIVTAVCTSCHTGHNVLPHDDPRSSIHKDNVVKTCMKCHGIIERVHRQVIAGALWKEQNVVPLCVECHSPHEARKVFYDTQMSNADCLRCHSDPTVKSLDGRSLFVNAEEHAGSDHGRHGVSCAQCHTEATPSELRACSTITGRVDCAICHEAAVRDYKGGRHGQLHAAGDPNAPYCTDCHGIHNVMEHTVDESTPPALAARIRESPTFTRNVPKLCGRCHREGGRAAVRYFGTEEHIVENYVESIHGKGLLDSGLTVTATCSNCHTAHKALPASDPGSAVNRQNIAQTCGQCHDGIYEQYEHSVHSALGNPEYAQRRVRGMPELPLCNDCHTSHKVARTDMPEFKLGIMDQCGKCHEDLAKSYFDTYHGKVSELGDTTKAKCYDCHGAHDILKPENPASRLSRQNIVATCGQCHPGSHRRFAGYLTHATHHDPDKYPELFFAFWGMTALLVGTFGFFGLHTLAWLPRSWKLRHGLRSAKADAQATGGKHFVRFPLFYRRLHVVMILSFFGLALTGMTLKFAYTPWATFLSDLLGGTESTGWIHRVCAVVTFGYMALHLWDVWRRYRGSGKSLRQFLLGPDTLLPKWSDLREFGQTMRWFAGRGPQPRYGKWTYWEKFDYFAVFWGVAIIGISGLCLWFPEFFTRLLPGWSINVATIVHSDEALLATGFIFTIHFFNTHFRPEKFPMDTVVFTGRMSVEELRHEKPRWYEELQASGELEKHLEEPPSPHFSRVVRVFGFSALAVGFTLVLLIIYAMLFAYR